VITVSFLFGLALIHLITVKLAKRIYKLSSNEKSAVLFFRSFTIKAQLRGQAIIYIQRYFRYKRSGGTEELEKKQIEQRLKFKYTRKEMEEKENQRKGKVETMTALKKYRKEKIRLIKDRLSVYTKHHVVPTLEEHSTKTFN
jgi:hypothetical protein